MVAAVAAPVASAQRTIDGSPLDVTVSADGNLQAALEDGTRIFFGGEGNAGFLLGFRDAVGSIPAGSVAGPGFGADDRTYTPATPAGQGEVTGTGSPADPFRLKTTYNVVDPTPAGDVPVLEVQHDVFYVNGRRTFRSSHIVRNLTNSAIRFRASWAADLTLQGNDSGYGFLSNGPPRFVGGNSEPMGPQSGAGGVIELASSPWSAFQEDDYSNVFAAARFNVDGFNNTISNQLLDNGVGVQWDDHYTTGMPPGDVRTFAMDFNAGPPALSPPPEPPPFVPAPPDGDGDGVTDATDACPAFAAPPPTGCPASGKPAVKAFVSAIRKALGGLSLETLSKKTSVGVSVQGPRTRQADRQGHGQDLLQAERQGPGQDDHQDAATAQGHQDLLEARTVQGGAKAQPKSKEAVEQGH